MKRGCPDHWKMRELARLLKIPERFALPAANGIMERLWHYTAKYAPQGDIGRMPDWAIAEACGYSTKDFVGFIDALCAAKWIEKCPVHRLVVHDWAEHCDDAVKKTLKNKGLSFCFPENSSTEAGKFRPALALAFTSASASALAFPEPLPAPSPPPPPTPPPVPKERANGAIDDEFSQFRTAAETVGLSGSEPDWSQAHFSWKILDFEQKRAAIDGLLKRQQCGEYDDPAFIPLPGNYLKGRLWNRPIRNKASPLRPTNATARAAMRFIASAGGT